MLFIMTLLFISSSTVTGAPKPLESNSWALLVAGTKGWWNYRHQSDICHAYHVLIKEGIPKDQIIVMMYDDIVNNTQNPNPGVILNKPKGPNVYSGVKIDYRDEEVKVSNFLNVLLGDKKAMKGIGSQRVIKSGRNTNIFINIVTEGKKSGAMSFPSDFLYPEDVIRALTKMKKNKKFNKVILYVDASYSGSLFDGKLSENDKVFALTSSARDEKSYGAYCHSNCLGGEFSTAWMEHMDNQTKGTFETFFHQYQVVRSLVKKSHVNMYGDFRIGTNVVTPNSKNKAKRLIMTAAMLNEAILSQNELEDWRISDCLKQLTKVFNLNCEEDKPTDLTSQLSLFPKDCSENLTFKTWSEKIQRVCRENGTNMVVESKLFF